jgi:hypothetical protein
MGSFRSGQMTPAAGSLWLNIEPGRPKNRLRTFPQWENETLYVLERDAEFHSSDQVDMVRPGGTRVMTDPKYEL